MAEDRLTVVSARITEDLYDRVLKFAEDNGFYNALDEPNASAAISALVSIGLEDSDGVRLIHEGYERARADAIQTVSHHINVMMKSLSEDLER